MNIKEMSNEFDILYNQVNSNQAPGIDEYEKSVFLTKAQDEIVKAYFDPRGNKFLEGFDNGQKRQYDFSLLTVNCKLRKCYDEMQQYDPRSYVYLLPKDLFLILNESIYEEFGGVKYLYQITPINFEKYAVLMKKPYQYPTKREVWRLITNQVKTWDTYVDDQEQQDERQVVNRGSTKETRTCVEIIGRFKGDYSDSNPEYRMRYIKKPMPIILVNLKDEYEGLSIDGKYGDRQIDGSIAVDDPDTGSGIPCYLPEGIHHEIVQRAVELATATYNPQALSNIVGVGNVSATNIGIVPRKGGEQ